MKRVNLNLVGMVLFPLLLISCKKEIPQQDVNSRERVECQSDKSNFRQGEQFSYTFNGTNYSNELFYERSAQLMEEFFKDVAKNRNDMRSEPELFVNFNFVFDPSTQTIAINDVAYIKDMWEYLDAWEKGDNGAQEYKVDCNGGTLNGNTMEVNDIRPGTISRAVGFVVDCIDKGGTITISKLGRDDQPIAVNMMIVYAENGNYAEWETDSFDFKTFLFGDL